MSKLNSLLLFFIFVNQNYAKSDSTLYKCWKCDLTNNSNCTGICYGEACVAVYSHSKKQDHTAYGCRSTIQTETNCNSKNGVTTCICSGDYCNSNFDFLDYSTVNSRIKRQINNKTSNADVNSEDYYEIYGDYFAYDYDDLDTSESNEKAESQDNKTQNALINESNENHNVGNSNENFNSSASKEISNSSASSENFNSSTANENINSSATNNTPNSSHELATASEANNTSSEQNMAENNQLQTNNHIAKNINDKLQSRKNDAKSVLTGDSSSSDSES